MIDPEDAFHHYFSTYCIHEDHAECRLTCKKCKKPCRCECHSVLSGPSYTCPVCGTRSALIIGPTQAFCTNVTSCHVIVFNPSLPDGGASKAEFLKRPAWMEAE